MKGGLRRLCVLAGLGAATAALACSGEPPPRPDTRPETPAGAMYVSRIYPILESKCLGCHHSDVDEPWYAAIPLLGATVRRDVEWGRQRLDLARDYPFNEGTEAGAAGYLHAIRTALLDDTMPPLAYWVTHPLAGLSDGERQAILDWVELALAENEEPGAEAEPVERVRHVLANRCARCHNEAVHEDMNGSFDFVMDLEFLAEDEDYIEPDDAEASPLFERLADDEDPMPPSPSDTLSDGEIAAVRDWIDRGAPAPE